MRPERCMKLDLSVPAKDLFADAQRRLAGQCVLLVPAKPVLPVADAMNQPSPSGRRDISRNRIRVGVRPVRFLQAFVKLLTSR